MKIQITIEETIRYDSEWTPEQIEGAYLHAFGAFAIHDIREAYPDEGKRLVEMVGQLRDAGAEPFCTAVEKRSVVLGQTWTVVTL